MVSSLFSTAVLLICAWVVIIMVAGCAERPLPVASGPVRQLNVGHWAPGPNELTTPAVHAGSGGA